MRNRHCKAGTLLLSLLFIVSLSSCCGQFFKGPEDLGGITISPDGNTVKLGSTQQFASTGIFGDSSGHTGDVTPRTSWTSSDPSIATIDANGLATGVAFGTVTIKGRCECYTSKATLTVSNQNISVTTITVSPSGQTISVGDTLQFSALATYSNNTTATITSAVTWTSSNSAVVSIGSEGLATASGPGSVTITATSGGITGTTTLTVRSVGSGN